MHYLACVLLVACGGGGGEVEGDPIIQTTLMAQFNNKPWTPMFGFARMEDSGKFAIFVGQEKISCADDFEGTPRTGNYAAIGFDPPVAVGNKTGLILNMIDVHGDLKMNIVPGSLMLTAVNETDVSATFAFDVTNTMGERSALNGALTVLRCP